MKKNMKRMGVVAALAIVAWGAVPAGADDNPAQFWNFASSWDEGLILGENFESMSSGDNYLAAGTLVGPHNAQDFLVGNDNPDLNGNHFDGSSGGADKSHVFTFAEDPGDHGAPTTGTYYIEGTVDFNIDEATKYLGHNFSVGVWNSSQNTAYAVSHRGVGHPTSDLGWYYGFGPNEGAHSGPDVFDPTTPTRAITAVNVEAGFATSYSFMAVDLVTGASWGHGGQDGVPSHIPGFGTPTLRVYYDRRGGQNIDMDDLRIGTVPWIPEPTTFALLGLGSLLMLRRRV